MAWICGAETELSCTPCSSVLVITAAYVSYALVNGVSVGVNSCRGTLRITASISGEEMLPSAHSSSTTLFRRRVASSGSTVVFVMDFLRSFVFGGGKPVSRAGGPGGYRRPLSV